VVGVAANRKVYVPAASGANANAPVDDETQPATVLPSDILTALIDTPFKATPFWLLTIPDSVMEFACAEIGTSTAASKAMTAEIANVGQSRRDRATWAPDTMLLLSALPQTVAGHR
jgi:hypothetical protein